MDLFLRTLKKEELLSKFLLTRDTLVSCKMEMFKTPGDKQLEEIFNITEKEFNELKAEIYRRMDNE